MNTGSLSSVPSPKSLGLHCVQNGPPARREEGAYLKRYVTDEQRSCRPIFNATLWAAAGWLFFRVARSTRPAPFLRRLRNSHTSKRQKGAGWALRSRLEKQPTDLRRNQKDLGDGALES